MIYSRKATETKPGPPWDIFIYSLFVLAALDSFAYRDTTVIIPLQRRYFHDKVLNEQKLCDKADGKIDNTIKSR